MRRLSLRITKVHHKPQKHHRNACALWRDALIAFDTWLVLSSRWWFGDVRAYIFTLSFREYGYKFTQFYWVSCMYGTKKTKTNVIFLKTLKTWEIISRFIAFWTWINNERMKIIQFNKLQCWVKNAIYANWFCPQAWRLAPRHSLPHLIISRLQNRSLPRDDIFNVLEKAYRCNEMACLKHFSDGSERFRYHIGRL